MSLSRFATLIAGAFLILAIAACGGSKDEDAPAPTLVEGARQQLQAAGDNVQGLAEVRTWLRGKIDLKTSESGALESILDETDRKLAGLWDTFSQSKAQAADPRLTEILAFGKELETSIRTENAGLADRIAAGNRLMQNALLASQPGNEKLRREMGYELWETDIDALRALPYIDTDDDLAKIQKLEAAAKSALVESPDGKKWLPPQWAGKAQLDEVLELVAERRAAHETRFGDPFEASAAKLADITRKALTETFNSSYEWVSRTYKPYVILVERDRAWDEDKVAQQKSEMLLQLYEMFYREYRSLLSLQDITDPVPVVVFRKHDAYAQYAAKRGADKNAVGHFEHDSGRLLVSDQTDRDTLFHEGTHQLIAYNTRGRMRADFFSQSYWFQEGIAEYFGATSVSLDPETKSWKYEMGLLQLERLSSWRNDPKNAYKLWDLLGITYRTREENKNSGDESRNLFAYSQGWFLIYFLNNFAVDAKGIVQLGARGKYRDGWEQYFKGELEGKTGRDFFLDCLGLKKDGKLDQAAFDLFESDFNRYFDWLNRKTSMKYHVKDRKLVPWDKVENKGRLIGEEIDDQLVTEAAR